MTVLRSRSDASDLGVAGVPSQGYPTTTAYGPGGIDVGGAGGAARSDGVRIRSSMSVLIASGVALVVFG